MKIIDIINQNEITISFEVFPPKTSNKYPAVEQAASQIAALHPDFMSVTYGAGGGTSEYTANIAASLQNKHGTPVLAHLTCVSSTREHVHHMLEHYQSIGIENIMALRGDIPSNGSICHDYHHASQLIREIKAINPDICIGAACYPEGHVECTYQSDDIRYLKDKVEAGCDFLTTQMFFDNNILYNFLYKIQKAGIHVPVVAGIMPITNVRQVANSVAMSGSSMPYRFRNMVDRFGHDEKKMAQAGVIYATEQIIDLIANGVNHIHVYSMNKPHIAAGIMNSLSEIIR